MRKIIVGSRKSELALAQTRLVIKQLKQVNPDVDFIIKEIVTKGDKILDVTLSKVGGKGLFVKEIEQALLDKEIDFAVHSLKDMPAEMPEGLALAAVLKREDPRDCLVSTKGYTLDTLPTGAKVGTSSLRRAAQILAYREDLHIESIRGNINTRLRKLDAENFDAIVLAAAGLIRMNWQEKITENLSTDLCIPAVGQGIIGVQSRIDDQATIEILEKINHQETRVVAAAERGFLNRLEGGCQIPIGAYATIENDQIEVVGIVASIDGKTILKDHLTAGISDKELIGVELAEKLLAKGADKILAQVKGEL